PRPLAAGRELSSETGLREGTSASPMSDTTATPPHTSAGAQAPRQFGRYDVVGLIGEGAMGRVYRGFDPLANRPVAIKTIKREHLSQETTGKYIRRFRREAQAA